MGYYAAGRARNATRRAIDPADEVQQRDLRGSDKRFPPVLPGNPISVWIVEGGTDALALHSMARRGGQQTPTVLVSGGANVRGVLETEAAQVLLRQADRVTSPGTESGTLQSRPKRTPPTIVSGSGSRE